MAADFTLFLSPSSGERSGEGSFCRFLGFRPLWIGANERLFLRRRGTPKGGIAMGKAAKLLDHRAMALGEVERHRGFIEQRGELLDAQFLQFRIFGMHEGHVEE